MSGWWILPNNDGTGQGRVTVDDASIAGIDCSSIPANVYLVRMWESKSDGVKGEILYNHDTSVPVRDKFTDITPYIPILNQWMIAITLSPPPPSPPLTVAQAQAVKIVMINALFNFKRVQPIVSVYKAESGEMLSSSYDASDENVSNMQSQAIGEVSGTAGSGSLGASVVTLQNSMNSTIASFNANLSQHDAYVGYYNSQNTQFNNDMQTSVGQINSATSNANSNTDFLNTGMPATINGVLGACTVTSSLSGSPPDSVGSTFNAYPMPNFGMPAAPYAITPSSPYLSTNLGQMAPVSAGSVPGGVGPSPTQQALAAIMNRRNSLKSTQNTHTNNVGALSSVSAIAAYDITTGW